MSREAFGAQFVGADNYLNSATYGLPPDFTITAVRESLTAWETGVMDPASFDQPTRVARAAYAALVGVSQDSVALGSSASALLGLVAAAVPDGARVATLAGEFTSVTFPFAAQRARGVTVTELRPDELLATATEYDVVAVSLVQSADGAVFDSAALRRAVAGSPTWTIFDLSQALGWKATDVAWADVTVAAAYKWLLSPRGTAWMSLSDRLAAAMTPHAANWYAGEDPWASIYGLPLRLAAAVRRFDTSPAWLSVLGASLSMSWLASLDRDAVEAHAVTLANRVRTALELPPSASAIVSIPIDGASDRLREKGIRASVRAGAVRVSFHLYNTDDDVDRLLDALS